MIAGLLALGWGAVTSVVFLRWIDRDLHHRVLGQRDTSRPPRSTRWIAHVREISVAALIVLPALGQPALAITSLFGFVVARNLLLDRRVRRGG